MAARARRGTSDTRARSQIARAELTCRRRSTTQRARTFRRSEAGLASLLHANPELAMLLETDCSPSDCGVYRHWRRKGRRGPKVPLRSPGEGRFDSLDLGLERKGKRRITSWVEALYAAVPSSRRWDDFRARLPYLEEATGARLMLPEESYRLADDEESFALCHEQAEHDLAEAMAQSLAKGSRRAQRGRKDKTRRTADKTPF